MVSTKKWNSIKKKIIAGTYNYQPKPYNPKNYITKQKRSK